MSWKHFEFDSLSVATDPAPELEVWQARRAVDPPWGLVLGDEDVRPEPLAMRWIQGQPRLPTLSLSSELPLSWAVHEVTPPGLEGARRVLIGLDDVFFPNFTQGSFSLVSPIYFFAQLKRLASEAAPLSLVGWGREDILLRTAPELFAGRGLACAFEIHRLAGTPRDEAAHEEPSNELVESLVSGRGTGDARASLIRCALTTRQPTTRLRLAETIRDLDDASALAWLLHGVTLAELGELDSARTSASRAATLDPDVACTHFEMGKILTRLEDVAEATSAFRRASECLPEFGSAWANLSASLGETGDSESARLALTRALDVDPMSHALHSNLGVCLRDLGQLSKAESAFRVALEIAPDFVYGHYNLAQVLYLQNRFAEAIDAFAAAQALGGRVSPRQDLLLAITHLAAGDRPAAEAKYRQTFGESAPPMRRNLHELAGWDLEQLATRLGTTPDIRWAEALVRELAT